MEVLRTAILEMCRQKRNRPFCPSEVVKSMFPEDWELFLEEVISVAIEMNHKGLIQITHEGSTSNPHLDLIHSIRISGLNPNQRKK